MEIFSIEGWYVLLRWFHVLAGITWIGVLYYFNFIQTPYFGTDLGGQARSAMVRGLVPNALWWFRWGAMFTFLTGVVLLELVRQAHGWDSYIIVGAVLGTLMFLNVWLIIWPNQKIVCGITEGDAAAAAPKAGLASRTNTLFSGPMLIGMMGSFHGTGAASYGTSSLPLGLWIALALIAALQLNAIFGKTGPMTTVKGVIHCSIGLTVVILALLQFV